MAANGRGYALRRRSRRIAVVMPSATSNHTAAVEYGGSLRNKHRANQLFIDSFHRAAAHNN